MPAILGTTLGLGLHPRILASPAASIILPITIGSAIGWSLSPKTKTTYRALTQPPLHPPAYLFGPVWTLLYGLMGYGIHHAYTTSHSHPHFPTTATLYTTQLALNFLWTPLFFGIEQPAVALVDILGLGVNLGALTWSYSCLGDEVAVWTMVPYLAWVSFATYLNIGVGILNGWDIKSKREVAKRVKKEE
ncbi:hypothetical protein TWF481_007407 [Arthrobotrys musiformis]|uniref:Translocator protein n=1 Tax=Arthrobotrys musiformis TaxID=47236 RepID=A0AAV9WCR4_9PEZI